MATKTYIVGLSEEVQDILSSSGLYLVDLEGIKLENIGKIDSNEYFGGKEEEVDNNFLDAFDKIYKRTKKLFLAQLQIMLHDKSCIDKTAESFLDEHYSDKILALSFLYKLGEETMEERIMSSRINNYTLLTAEEAKERKYKYRAECERYLSDFARIVFNEKKERTYYYTSDLP